MTLITARETTAKYFGNGSNEVTAEEIFKIAGRDLADTERNKTWLTNKLTHLKHYNLVEPVYSTGRPRKLVGVRLTHQGMNELGRSNGSTPPTPPANTENRSTINGGDFDLETMTRITDEFHDKNPSWRWDLVRVREDKVA